MGQDGPQVISEPQQSKIVGIISHGEHNTFPNMRFIHERTHLCLKKNIGDISGNITYDAARSKWDGQWRMATMAEFLELVEYCEGKVGMVNGVKGCVITGPNGNSIFIPYNGVKSGGTKVGFCR